MIKKVFLCFIIFHMLAGCSTHTGKKDIMSTVQSIEQHLKEADRGSLKQQVIELRKHYDKHEWKIQLLGDEGEYERLNETINRLIAAIDMEELSDAQLELATIKSIIKDIYSL